MMRKGTRVANSIKAKKMPEANIKYSTNSPKPTRRSAGTSTLGTTRAA